MELYEFACELKTLQERVWDLEEENQNLKRKLKESNDHAIAMAQGSQEVAWSWMSALFNGDIEVKIK